jgi:predicted nucleotidyltransferase
MTLRDIRGPMRDRILSIASHHGAHNVRIFGSFARGDQTESSDLDVLVELAPDRSLMDLGGLLMALQEEVGIRVDVATERMLRPEIRSRALAEAVPL